MNLRRLLRLSSALLPGPLLWFAPLHQHFEEILELFHHFGPPSSTSAVSPPQVRQPLVRKQSLLGGSLQKLSLPSEQLGHGTTAAAMSYKHPVHSQVVQAPRSVHTARRWPILPHWVGLALGSSTGSRIPQSSTCWGRVLSKRSFLPPLKTRVSVIGAADSWPPGCVHSWPGSEGGPLPGFPAEEHAGGSRL